MLHTNVTSIDLEVTEVDHRSEKKVMFFMVPEGGPMFERYLPSGTLT